MAQKSISTATFKTDCGVNNRPINTPQMSKDVKRSILNETTIFLQFVAKLLVFWERWDFKNQATSVLFSSLRRTHEDIANLLIYWYVIL